MGKYGETKKKEKRKEESWWMRQDERGTKRNVRLICPICSIESLFHSPRFFHFSPVLSCVFSYDIFITRL